jgi:DNA polymerase
MVNRETQESKHLTTNYQSPTPTKQQLLDQIKADILEQNICPDLAEKATQLVFGEGSPDADIVFIGEAPGKREDESGQPFVGASGKFLSEMLASINLKREQVYITNIVKYRPPNNRDPLPEEKAAFLPFLQKQLEVIKPLLIVTLGRHSGLAFIPTLNISEHHGQPMRIEIKGWGMVNGKWDNPKYQLPAPKPGKIVILPLYHPAAALYNGSLRQTSSEDFAQIPAILNKIRKTK